MPEHSSVMARFLVFISIFLHSLIGIGQNFEFVAGDTLERTFEINDYSIAHTKIKNWSAASVVFNWEIITFNHPAGWEFSLCDLPFCYTSGETTGTMLPAGPLSEEAFLTINIEATYPDTGFYQIAVWDEEFSEERDTLTVVMIATPAYSIITENRDFQTPISVYFNLLSNQINLKNTSEQSFSGILYNLTGTVIMEFDLLAFEQTDLPVSGYAKGLYLIRFSNPLTAPHSIWINLP